MCVFLVKADFNDICDVSVFSYRQSTISYSEIMIVWGFIFHCQLLYLDGNLANAKRFIPSKSGYIYKTVSTAKAWIG